MMGAVMNGTEATTMNKNTIAIVGCGLMGSDVAAIFLAAGWNVQAAEPDCASWEARRERVRSSVRQLDGTFHADRLRLVKSIQEIEWTNIKLVLEAAPE